MYFLNLTLARITDFYSKCIIKASVRPYLANDKRTDRPPFLLT